MSQVFVFVFLFLVFSCFFRRAQTITNLVLPSLHEIFDLLVAARKPFLLYNLKFLEVVEMLPGRHFILAMF